MKPRDFLDLADELVIGSGEAEWRSAVSRAYYAAFRLPDTLFSLIAGGALSSAMIPVLLSATAEDGEESGVRLINLVLNLLFSVSFRGISIGGHLGGLIAGLITGWLVIEFAERLRTLRPGASAARGGPFMAKPFTTD